MLPFFLTANADAHASPGSRDAFSVFPVYSGRMGACVVPQALMNGEDMFFVHEINPLTGPPPERFPTDYNYFGIG